MECTSTDEISTTSRHGARDRGKSRENGPLSGLRTAGSCQGPDVCTSRASGLPDTWSTRGTIRVRGHRTPSAKPRVPGTLEVEDSDVPQEDTTPPLLRGRGDRTVSTGRRRRPRDRVGRPVSTRGPSGCHPLCFNIPVQGLRVPRLWVPRSPWTGRGPAVPG